MGQTIALIANLAIALSFITAFIFGVAQVKAAKRDRQERLTLDTLRSFHTREFCELLYLVNNMKAPPNWTTFRQGPKEDQVMFMQFGQQMESLGILVAEGFIDLDLVDKTLGSFVTTSWEKYKHIFTEIREKAPDPFLAEYFQWLAERIDQRMKECPRQPFQLQQQNKAQ